MPHRVSMLFSGYLKALAQFCSITLLLAIVAHSKAQTGSGNVLTPALQTGVTAGGSYSGDQENVNMVNGNVSIRVPLINLPGLGGFNLKLDLLINSARYGMRGGGAPTHSSAGTLYTSPAYQPFPDISNNDYGFAGGRLSIPEITSSNLDIPVSGQPDIQCLSGFVVIDTNGAPHAFQNVASCYQGSARSTRYETPSIDDTYDGSFMRLDTTNPSDIIAYLKDGTQYHFDTSSTKIIDPNGNQISISTSYDTNNTTYQAVLVDSEGRTVTVTPSGISYTDVNGTPRTISVTSSTDQAGSAATVSIGCTSSDGVDIIPPVAKDFANTQTHYSLAFPNGATYQLTYDSLLELTKIIYPTGGYSRYDYQNIDGAYFSQYWTCRGDVREIMAKHVCGSSSGSCSSEDTTTYTPTMESTGRYIAANQYMDVRDPAKNRTRYAFSTTDWYGVAYYGAGTLETDRYIYSGESTLLRTIHTDYTTDSTYPGYTIRTCSLPIRKTTTLNDVSSLQSKVETDYDTIQLFSTHYATLFCGTTGNYIDNPIAIREYDYDGSLKRTTTQSWYSRSPNAPHILDRLASSTKTDASGFQTSSGHGYDTAGNIISSTTSGTGVSALTTMFHRNTHGDVTLIQDPKGNQTTFSYDNPWGDSSCPALASGKPSSVTNALGQVTSYKYSSCIGSVTSSKDANQQSTSYSYDSVGRLYNTSYPDGGDTRINYQNPNTTVTTVSAAPDPDEVSTSILDGLGRPIQQIGPGPNIIDTGYDFAGRVVSKSNPHLSSASPSDGTTTYSYDALGRKSLQCDTDNSSAPTTSCQPGNSYLQWGYAGNTIDYYDETRRHWQRTYDALGRLTKVLEPDGSTNINVAPTLETDYQYDAADDLTQVKQGGGALIRTFTYDGLSRLITASNPETGTTCYGVLSGSSCINGYDADSNLVAKTDARGVTTTYSYDALNRLTGKTYSDGITPSVFFGYDESAVSLGSTPLPVTNGIGRLTSEGVGSVSNFSWKAFHSYDAMGRTLNYRQYWPGPQGAPGMPRAYDLAGNVTAWNNGAGRWFQTGYDAAGRPLNLLTAPLSGIVDATLVANVTYGPAGELYTELGNGAEVRFTYDKHMRPLTYRMAIAQNVFSYLDAWGITYDLNGNILNAGDSHYEGYGTYTYDNLNRLLTVNTTLEQGCQYGYDSFGNRNSETPYSPGNCFNSSNTFSGNRISTPGFQYDAAGNLLHDGNYTYGYDAENRLVSVQGQGSTVSYQYNPDGIRTTKVVNGVTTVYGYDDNGRLMWTNYGYGQGRPDEVYFNGRHFGYVVENIDQSLSSITYSSTNWIGTELARFGETQNVVGRFGSLPYGDNQTVLAGGDDDTLHYTGKERDTESALDYFGARYYTSSMGRFMSPDFNGDPDPVPYADIENPQTLNLYSYVQNNPLGRRDFDGHASWQNCPDGSGTQCWVGDYNGEYNNGLFWNGQSSEWQQNDPNSQPDSPAGEFFTGLTRTMIANTVSDLGYGVRQMATGITKDSFTLGAKSVLALVTPNLKFLHSKDLLEQNSNIDSVRKMSTQQIIDSLKPGQPDSLKVKADGTIMDGNTRLRVLEERGVDINSLPRELYSSETIAPWEEPGGEGPMIP